MEMGEYFLEETTDLYGFNPQSTALEGIYYIALDGKLCMTREELDKANQAYNARQPRVIFSNFGPQTKDLKKRTYVDGRIEEELEPIPSKG